MDIRLPPVPSIFDADFGSKQPIGLLLDRLSVSGAERKRKNKDRTRERERLETERCPEGQTLKRAMDVLEGAAADVSDALADGGNTADDYREMVEELIGDINRVARWARK